MSASRESALPHIVVLGAGFAGLTFAKRFPAALARITVVDRQNHHLFQPLLYQVATAGLAGPDIAQPIRSILRNRPHLGVRLARLGRLAGSALGLPDRIPQPALGVSAVGLLLLDLQTRGPDHHRRG